MRIIARKTLRDFWENHPDSEQPLKAWFETSKKALWSNHNELKAEIAAASIVGSKRVVFNIKGNDYRLIADIEYYIRQIFVVWIGTHAEYDKINVKQINYVKSDKNKKRARSRS